MEQLWIAHSKVSSFIIYHYYSYIQFNEPWFHSWSNPRVKIIRKIIDEDK